jgi:hypothetical protein
MGTLKAKSFRCEEVLWRRFKLICTIEDATVQDKLGDLVKEYVKFKEIDFLQPNQIGVTRLKKTGNSTQ